MATVKINLRKSPGDTDGGMLYFRVTHRGVTVWISSGIALPLEEWDEVHGDLLIPDDADAARKEHLYEVKETLEIGKTRLGNIVKRLDRDRKGTYSAADVAREYRKSDGGKGFVAFGRREALRLLRAGRRATAERYGYVLDRFEQFLCGGDIPLKELDSRMTARFEGYLRKEGVSANSSSYYLRNLRAVYGRAVDRGLAEDAGRPFRRVYTGVDRTPKRAVPAGVLRRMAALDFGGDPLLEFVRDLFLFQTYTRGMSFVDLAYLRKSDLRGGNLTYRRHKTGRELSVRWEREMQDIVDRCGTPDDSPYMFPVIRDPLGDTRTQYKNALRMMNRKLKVIGRMAGIDAPLTTYVARHTWATTAQENHVPVPVISAALGHDSEKTTRIYLANLCSPAVDDANRLVLGALGRGYE